MDSNELLVCDQCDLILRETVLQPGGKAFCARCGNVLYRCKPDGLRLSLIFSLTGAALFLISNSFPIVTIDSQGLTNSTTLLDAADRLVHDGIPSIAALVFATTFLMPALEIMAMIYLLLPLHFQRMPPGFSVAFRLIHFVKPWAMIEVFMLGLLVTISKLSALASVVPNIALGSFVLLMFSVTAAAANFDRRGYWKRVAEIRSMQEHQAC
jgi:paraquat-inducible protein A